MKKTFQPIITSLLDDDLYKLTMWQVMLHAFPGNDAEYRFVCRNKPEFPLSTLVDEVKEQIEHLCTLRFTEEQLDYLSTRSYLKKDFIDFLRIFRFQMRYITVEADGDDLVVIARGPQIHTTAFEIHVLSIVNELYFRRFETPEVLAEGRARLAAKIDKMLFLNETEFKDYTFPFEVVEFGTRRRFSGAWQTEVVKEIMRRAPNILKGTSNIQLAMDTGLTPNGTMAHEFLQTFQTVGVQLRKFQKEALESWVKEYRGDLGIALTDVIGMDAFLDDFDLYFAKLFDGLRHDSGNPTEWGEKALAHYQKLRIDAKTKRLVFSDGLDVEVAATLYRQFANRIPCGFGIGTNLTNDLGVKPLNIVMKLVRCNNQPVAKLSDSPGKTLCQDETFLSYLRQVFAQQ